MFNPFNPNHRNSLPGLPGISCCLDGERGNPESSHHRNLDYIKISYPVIGCKTCHAEPGTPFPAHLIIPELILHAYVIRPDQGNKDHEEDKHSERVRPAIIQSSAETIITGTFVQKRISTKIKMKSTMNYVVSASEGLNVVLSGKI